MIVSRAMNKNTPQPLFAEGGKRGEYPSTIRIADED